MGLVGESAESLLSNLGTAAENEPEEGKVLNRVETAIAQTGAVGKSQVAQLFVLGKVGLLDPGEFLETGDLEAGLDREEAA